MEGNNSKMYSLRQYFWQLYKLYKLYIFFFLLFSTILGLNGFVNSYLIKTIINLLIDNWEKPYFLRTIFWPGLFIVLYIEIYSISWRSIDYIKLKLFPIIRNNIIIDAFDYIHKQSFSFFQQNLSGTVANNINILAENIEKISGIMFVRVTRGITQIYISFIAMYFVHPIFAFGLLTWAISFIIISFKFSKKIIDLANDCAKSQSEISGKMVDSIANFATVKIFAKANFELSNLRNSLDKFTGQYQLKEWFLIKFHYFQGLSITILISFMTYILIQLRIKGQVTIGDFAFILGLSLHVTEYVWTLTEYIDQMNEAVGKCRQSLNTLFQPINGIDKRNAKKIVVTEGVIVFDKVHFQYKDAEPLFQDKSVIINKNQKVGLVGYSGSGKSTFINLLLRFYNLESGSILIDKQDINFVTQTSLHESIGIIPQDPLLFHRSIKENICYGKIDATDEEIMEAAKKADIHSFIYNLPKGYDSLVGERGIKLSGGQKQRIAFARVILKDAPILILDEATSQLDSITENTIKNTLDNFMRNKTTIIIAHRLSTLLNMDRILVFDQGKIVEDGTHLELLKNNGLYKKLWYAQIGGFLPTTNSNSD